MHLTLHLTKACNMRCGYCYSPPVAGRGMSGEVGRKAMQMGAKWNHGACGVVFFGGEPLLEKERILELVGYGKQMEQRGEGRFHFKITTNGLLLDDAFLEFADREGVMIAMSFDGVKEAHDAHRRAADGSGTFEVLLGRLEKLLEVKPYSSVIMVVNPNTAGLLAEGVDFLIELGAKYVIVALNYAAAWDVHAMGELKRQYERLGRMYVNWTREGRKFYLSPFEVKLSSHINRECFAREQCDLGRRQISVDPEGYLFPCVQFVKAGRASSWCVGSVWDGLDATKLRQLNEQSHREKAVCAACEVKARCSAGCACLAWQATGAIDQVCTALCEHERMLIPIVDRVGSMLYRRGEAMFIQKHYNPAYPVLSLMEDATAT